ncbi:MAG: ABC transporter permease [Treponema sp.]|nr:ABC transporter permease [Treponema sp.]
MKQAVRMTGVFPLAVGLLFTVILLAASSGSITAATDFLTGSFTSLYYFGAILNTAAFFMAAGLGDAVLLTTGEFNLGGEGQIYAGGFMTAVVLSATTALPPAVSLVCALAAATVVPACMTLISGLLKQFKNANILLTTFLVSAAVIPFIDSLIAGPFRGPYGNLLATPFIRQTVRFPHILPPSPLSVIALTLPLFCISGGYFIYRTRHGKILQITGISAEFADYCGYSRTKIMYGTLAAAGVLHGLTGFIAVTGTYYTCHSGFYSGLGWDALSCSLIAGSNPVALIPSSLILSCIFTSADRVALNYNSGFDISALIQGVMLSCIAIQYAGGKKNDRHHL